MKKIIFALMVFWAINIYGQMPIKINKSAEKSSISLSYSVDVRPYLEKFSKANGIDFSKIEPQRTLKKSSMWGFTVGSKHTWTASDLENNNFYNVPSTCRAVGNNCYIFVEDALWNKETVDQDAVNAVLNAFDKSTPANSTKGIYQTVVETFGNPPDVDGDPKIIILILDIKDGYMESGGYVSGYFYSYNEMPKSEPNYSYSNEAEIYYLDGVQNKLLTEAGLTNAMSTTAHEFQHMVHFNYISQQETFFDEAWSLAAEFICGYEIYNQNLYAQESDHYLLDWRRDDNNAVLTDYSRAARFSLYLYEQYGASFFKEYLNKKIKGFNGVSSTLSSFDNTLTSSTLLENWFLANFINDRNVNPKWGYSYPGLPKMTDIKYFNPNVSVASASVFKYGVDYITFTNGSNLNVKFTTNEKLNIKAIKKTSSGNIEVENVQFGTDYSLTSFGSEYSAVTFMVYHVDQNAYPLTKAFQYSFNATGTFENKPIEIAYDKTEPVGVYVLSVGDTVAVIFDGIAGTQLDSIRVALRNEVPMEGGVWSSLSNKVLAKRYAHFEAKGTSTPAYNNATQSYPVPYPNWVTVDLREFKIDAGSNFAVAFVIDGVYENSSSPTNRVMHTEITSSGPYHSYTYLHEPSEGKLPGWYYIGDGDNISLYLIRAYVSYKVKENKEIIELLPASFSLEQNYPNPFNPTTIITYTLPEMSEVQIKIYDILGREVRNLINEVKSAGKHSILWDGKDNSGNRVNSGTYFYQIKAGNFVQTRKMLMVK
ncbi:FlgD immunoglobulin-like domain containing protein [Melioribacter sp. OK-6-Me]|uniref:FlgD immunoglobulin-like domain containing protein n=1 Tax=unclassified Melioribacter TaxID=2627329 RepID=UPI003ED87B6A